jgi:hypothetical protein
MNPDIGARRGLQLIGGAKTVRPAPAKPAGPSASTIMRRAEV